MSLRVLILVETFNPITETFIYNDVNALHKKASVKVVCLKRENEKNRPFDSVEVISIQKNWIRAKWKNQLYKLDISLTNYHKPLKDRLGIILQEFQPQVIHLHFGFQALQFIDNLKFSGPIFLTFHGYDATKLVKKSAVYRKRLKELFLRKNVYPLFVSAAIKRNLENYGLESPNGSVLYMGVDPNFFCPSAIQRGKDDFVFIQISSFRTKKGHYYLLEAFSRLLSMSQSDRELRLVLAGGGDLLEEVKKKVIEKQLQNHVEFPGWVNEAMSRTLLSSSDVFVHPSITPADGDMEGLPISIMEAMSMELPVFATKHSGIPELVENGVNGLLANEKDIDGYVNCLKSLLEWTHLRTNRQKIIDHFNHAKYIDRLISNYQKAIASTR